MKSFFFILVLPLFVNGFFRKNPLRKIIMTKAITNSIIENISMELLEPSMVYHMSSEYLIPNMMNILPNNDDVFKNHDKRMNFGIEIPHMNLDSPAPSLLCIVNNGFLVIYILACFGYFGVVNDNKKLGYMDEYVNTKRFIKNIMFVLFFVFAKNVKDVL